MKKKTPYLDFYNLCMKTGLMPKDGLCNSLREFGYGCDQFIPLHNEADFFMYWGSDQTAGKVNMREHMFAFNPLRQTIVLFLAAMNNEL